MRNLLIIPAMPNYVPYISTYTDLMDSMGIEYDVVCWNRKGETTTLPRNYIIYNVSTSDTYPFVRKIYDNYRFYRFVKPLIDNNKYRCVFVYTIITGLLFKNVLINQYKGKYVFDIRDYSPAMRSRLSVIRMKGLLHNSYLNVISSDGFREWLPKEADYLTTHNVKRVDIQKYSQDYTPFGNSDKLYVLNIGAIRDVSSNMHLIKELGNKDKINLLFVGNGLAVPYLKNFVEQHMVKNVSFYGRYDKKDEVSWVQKSDMINSYLPHTMVADYLMSNRFYLSVMLRRPLIVNEGCFQAKIVEKYGLGLVISPREDVYCRIQEYWSSIDWMEYNKQCRNFLEVVSRDLLEHERYIKLLLQKENDTL